MNWISPLVADVAPSLLNKDLLVLIGREGSFAVGVLLGCVVTLSVHALLQKPLTERFKIDLEREKELHKQLQLRDDRINALHTELAKLSKKRT